MSLDRLNREARCPECDCADFIIGPRAGRASNICCADCGRKYWYSPPFPPCVIDSHDSLFTEPPVNLRQWTASPDGPLAPVLWPPTPDAPVRASTTPNSLSITPPS